VPARDLTPPTSGDLARSLTVLRGDDAVPGRTTPWRDVDAVFLVPPAVRSAADAVRHLLDEPELHFAPGLRRGTLAVLPRVDALTRVALAWEWSVEAADFSVHSLGPSDLTDDDRAALEAWLRVTARLLTLFSGWVDAAVDRLLDDVVEGRDVSVPPVPTTPAADTTGPAPLAGGTAPVTAGPAPVRVRARLGTRVDVPDASGPHPRVDVELHDPADPGWEAFVDAATRAPLGYRRTIEHEGLARAFTYFVADDVDDVTPGDLVHWHDQHIQRQMLADDARQAYVHLLAGLEPPRSVRYA